MKNLSDQLLIEAYEKAVELNLDSDFISILLDEMNERYLNIQYQFTISEKKYS